MSKHANRLAVKFTKDLHPSRAKLKYYPRFQKPNKRKMKRKKDNE